MSRNLLVFCGSKPGMSKAYTESCKELARCMKAHKYNLVYGGGKVGMMGAIADACLSEELYVTGVIPKFLEDKELAHPQANEMISVESMHERKLKMFQLSDAILALPGGIGTMEELFEMFTWKQLRLHDLPIAVLNTEGYYNPLVNMLNQMVEQGFLDDSFVNGLVIEESPEELMNKLSQLHEGNRLNSDLSKT